jgi:hypothetical protein
MGAQLVSTAFDSAHVRSHLQPLDIVIVALEESPCPWCQGLLRLLKSHLEEFVPAGYGLEVLN